MTIVILSPIVTVMWVSMDDYHGLFFLSRLSASGPELESFAHRENSCVVGRRGIPHRHRRPGLPVHSSLGWFGFTKNSVLSMDENVRRLVLDLRIIVCISSICCTLGPFAILKFNE